MNKVMHKDCGGEIFHQDKKALCTKCNEVISQVDELLSKACIIELDDSEVVETVKENQ